MCVPSIWTGRHALGRSRSVAAPPGLQGNGRSHRHIPQPHHGPLSKVQSELRIVRRRGHRSPPGSQGRPWNRRLLLALCFAACFTVAWSGHLSSSATVSPASASSAAPKYFFGLTPDFGGANDAALSAYYKHIKRGGASWVRFGVYWWYIEKSKGVYTWHSTDRYFAAAACSGLVALRCSSDRLDGPLVGPAPLLRRGRHICPSSKA